jgi:hypothetical protein
MKMKNIYIKRNTNLENIKETIVIPVMQQVKNKNIKKNLGLTLISVAGAINFLPIHKDYTGKTNPIQTLSSHLSRLKLQPHHFNKTDTTLENTTIYTIPQLKTELEVPIQTINRFKHLCEKYGIDHHPFTTEAHIVELTKELLKVIAYFASDLGNEPENCIWGTIKPIIHIDHTLFDTEDLSYRIRNKVEGRKRGRPKKIMNNV